MTKQKEGMSLEGMLESFGFKYRLKYATYRGGVTEGDHVVTYYTTFEEAKKQFDIVYSADFAYHSKIDSSVFLKTESGYAVVNQGSWQYHLRIQKIEDIDETDHESEAEWYIF